MDVFFFFAPKKILKEITIPGARARREGEKVQLCFDTQRLGSTKVPPTSRGSTVNPGAIYVPLTTNPQESREPDDPGLTLNPLKTNINGWKIPAMNEDVRILVKMWDFPMLC